MAGPFNIAIKAVLKQLGKGSARAVPEDIMSGTVRRIKQEASLHETPRRVLGKELDEYTGPHSDFKRKEGLESVEKKEGLEAIGETEIKSFKDKYFRGDDKTRYRSSRLEEQARALDEGVITLDEFKEIRDVIKPLKTYGRVPPLNKQVDEAGELISPDKFDPIEIVGPIGKTRVDNSGIIGFNKFIKEGERATSRFDIDAYNHYDRYIPVIQTLVDKVTKATGKITKKFAKKGYSPTAVLTNVTFNYDPKKAFSIAKGRRGVSGEGKEYPLGEDIKLKKGDTKLGEKEPFATMEGNWKNLTPEEAHRYAKEKIGTEGWTEVGFDPAARQSFYNRATGEPVFKADEVIQVGAMLLARGLRKATPKQLESLKITTKAGKEITYKQGGQVSEGLSSIVSRKEGGNLSFEDKMYEHAMRVLNKETLNPSYYHTDIRDERGLLDPVNFVVGTAFEDEEDESDKFYYMEAMKAAKRDSKEAEKRWNIAKSFDPDPNSDSASKDNWRVIGRDPFKDTGYKVVQDEQGREWSELDGAAIDTISGLKHGGKTKRKKKDKVFYADFDRKGRATPELSNRIAISRLMEDLEWERIPKEVKRKRREEAEQWEDMKFIQEAMKEDKKGTQMFMPNQDLYKNPIFKDVVTKRKGGGLSNIKKSININGQPHSLAWINPDEASALRAMGGSGKKGPMGIPSYQEDEDDYVDASANIEDTVGPDEGGYSWDWGPTGGYSYATDTRAEGPEKTGYSDEELRDYAAGLGTTVRGLGPIGTKRAKAEHHDTLTDIRKGLWGDDYLTRGEALDRAKGRVYKTWRNSSAGKHSLDPDKDYNEWFAAQDQNALIAGGYGAALTANLNIVNQQLINRAKENLQKEAASSRGVTEEEREKYERQSMIDAAKSGKIEHLEDFTEKGELPAALQFGLTGQLMKLASRTVIGTGTVGGVGVHVHEDGSVTAISPEDSPGYDYEAHHEPGGDTPIKKKKLLPRSVSSAAPVEKELTGMEALLTSRPKATARKDSNVHLSALLDQIYGEGQGQSMLG
jgi:hypothetical protein